MGSMELGNLLMEYKARPSFKYPAVSFVLVMTVCLESRYYEDLA